MIERELQPAHTAGPWHRNIPPATKYTVIFAGRNTHICRVIPDGLTPEEVEANCDLIVAAPAMADELTRLRKVNGELVAALERCQKLVSLVTIRQCVDDGNPAIQAAGLNPWCINEGLATGEENISTWWIEAALKNSKEAI